MLFSCTQNYHGSNNICPSVPNNFAMPKNGIDALVFLCIYVQEFLISFYNFLVFSTFRTLKSRV